MQRNVVVTGGSSGIGLAICEKFNEAGYKVFNLDIKRGSVGHFYECDMRDHSQVERAIEEVRTVAHIDTLVCNAGRHLSASIEDTDESSLVDMFNLNVKGAYSVTKSLVGAMKDKGFGRIIYIASDQAIIAKQNSFAYNLTKHALASMAKTTAVDYAKYGITSNAICPGTIDTPLYRTAIQNYCEKSGSNIEEVHAEEESEQAVGRLGTPEEVADYALFLSSETSGFITGSLQVIDGGYTVK